MLYATISLTEEADECLKALKRHDESFSDVVQRRAGADQDEMNGFGSWKGTGLRTEIDDYRDEFDRDFTKRTADPSRE